MSHFYVRVNKTGSLSMVNWLKCSVNKCERHQYRWGKEQLHNIIQTRKNLKFFTVVRNPYARAVSIWKHLFNKHKFIEFLKLDYEDMNQTQLYHAIPQYDYISDSDGSINYLSHVGRLENINTTCQYLINNGYADLKNVEFPHEHKSTSFTQDIKHVPYTHYYNDEAIELVEEKYSIDFEHFDYTFGDNV